MEELDRGVDHRVCGRGRRVGVPQSVRLRRHVRHNYRLVGSYYLSSNTIDCIQEER